ncbi:MAG: pyridoxamine 5'-phosphate oxidase [Sphingobacteriales bacterium]|nr:pyridoxamine 5'-phosphate oxidase [Sphingobacteriales bacterium]
MESIADIRKDYMLQTLLEQDMAPDPYQQFGRWWADALKSDISEVNAMTLATASLQGMPDARIVLLKEYTEKGFVFFTNYESDKGVQLKENPNACLVFFWKELERQVRVTGSVEKISAEDSDAYFYSRPVESRVGAWASPQSTVIAGRHIIEANVIKLKQEFEGKPVTRPPHWGGYIVMPHAIEFWQGRPSRLHDRFQYKIQDGGGWSLNRLAP